MGGAVPRTPRRWVLLKGTTRILFSAEDRIVRVDSVDSETHPPAGTELTDYIGSEELAGLYVQLFAAVRNSRPRMTLMARCDGPSERAVLQIEISRYGTSGQIELRSSIVRRSDRTIPLPPAESVDPGAVVVLICSWCNCVKDEAKWVELENYVASRGWLVNRPPRVGFTHGLCPPCSTYLRAAASGASGSHPPVDF